MIKIRTSVAIAMLAVFFSTVHASTASPSAVEGNPYESDFELARAYNNSPYVEALLAGDQITDAEFSDALPHCSSHCDMIVSVLRWSAMPQM
ncbi:MAG: hypothetical protein FWG15_04675 [Propionibacteriaceae bacterium]|nr:hypothetical protein [Propionibacteriaceae bacterium]